MIIMDFILRILVAALLGGAIGLERGFRAKEAGFRTHFLVALGSAVFMILSAHGFGDVQLSESQRLDVSRIAAQVVSGIGFIGAGTIIFQRQAVHGLTTAAGLWVTASIGMAAGAGMYVIAGFTTLLVLIGLEVLNVLFPTIGHHNLTLTVAADSEEAVRRLTDRLKADGTGIVTYSLTKDAEGGLVVRMELKPVRSGYADHVFRFVEDMEGVTLKGIE
ncbi:MAG: MgtC/SapB family protein [Bacteroidaceae bacterium]|nr:MgtC/SapB family protein [Bacteroidaceae bacterium]